MMRYQIELPQMIVKGRTHPEVTEQQRGLYAHKLHEQNVNKIIASFIKGGRKVDIVSVIRVFNRIKDVQLWNDAANMAAAFRAKIWNAGYIT